MNDYIDVVGGVIYRNNRVLMTRRGPNQPLPLKWEFPGGKIDDGETPEVALERELFEELGIRCTIGKFIGEGVYHYGTHGIRLLAYEIREFTGEITLSVHDLIEWVEPDKCIDLDLAKADIPIATILAKLDD